MNKLLLLGLFSACLIVITQGSQQVEEKDVAETNAEVAAIREAREADPKKKKGNKGKNQKRNQARKSKNKNKTGKNKGGNKSKRAKGKKKARKVRKNGKNGSRRKSKKNTKSNKGKKRKSAKKPKNKKAKKNNKKRARKDRKKLNKRKNSRRTNSNKGSKNKNRKNSRKSEARATTCMNETCINTAMKYMKIMKDRVSNFLKQKTRITKYNETSGNKAGKKGLFGPILNRIREAGGGNSSNLKCNGDNSSSGATQLKNLTSLLILCEDNINTSCNANLPVINTTSLPC